MSNGISRMQTIDYLVGHRTRLARKRYILWNITNI
jgi:hypothetical protein